MAITGTKPAHVWIDELVTRNAENEMRLLYEMKRSTVRRLLWSTGIVALASTIILAGAAYTGSPFDGGLGLFWFVVTIFFALKWHDEREKMLRLSEYVAAAVIRGPTAEDLKQVTKFM